MILSEQVTGLYVILNIVYPQRWSHLPCQKVTYNMYGYHSILLRWLTWWALGGWIIRYKVLEPTPKTVHYKYILILRMSTTVTSDSHVGFGSSNNKTLNPYDFCIQNTHMNALYFFWINWRFPSIKEKYNSQGNSLIPSQAWESSLELESLSIASKKHLQRCQCQ